MAGRYPDTEAQSVRFSHWSEEYANKSPNPCWIFAKEISVCKCSPNHISYTVSIFQGRCIWLKVSTRYQAAYQTVYRLTNSHSCAYRPNSVPFASIWIPFIFLKMPTNQVLVPQNHPAIYKRHRRRPFRSYKFVRLFVSLRKLLQTFTVAYLWINLLISSGWVEGALSKRSLKILVNWLKRLWDFRLWSGILMNLSPNFDGQDP